MTKRMKILAGILFAILVIECIFLLVSDKTDLPSANPEQTTAVTETAEPEQTETAETAETQQPEESEEPEDTYNAEEDPRFFDTNSFLIVANKKHRLPEGYVPVDLAYPEVEMRYNNWLMRYEAALYLEKMFAAAEADGVHLVMGSGYRGEDFQAQLYNGYVESYGQEIADEISSRPGYSDHQTGLATDLCGQDSAYDLSQLFEETAEGQWLHAHAHEYGFIMRYPKGKEEITGYAYEPWHFRYVGVETATAIYETDEWYTFEEYFGIEGGDYAD